VGGGGWANKQRRFYIQSRYEMYLLNLESILNCPFQKQEYRINDDIRVISRFSVSLDLTFHISCPILLRLCVDIYVLRLCVDIYVLRLCVDIYVLRLCVDIYVCSCRHIIQRWCMEFKQNFEISHIKRELCDWLDFA